jgi:hypothetical protein
VQPHQRVAFTSPESTSMSVNLKSKIHATERNYPYSLRLSLSQGVKNHSLLMREREETERERKLERRKRDICRTHSAKRLALMNKIVTLERLASQDMLLYHLFY